MGNPYLHNEDTDPDNDDECVLHNAALMVVTEGLSRQQAISRARDECKEFQHDKTLPIGGKPPTEEQQKQIEAVKKAMRDML